MSVPQVEAGDRELESNNGVAFAGILYTYDDFKKGGQVDTKGAHYTNEVVPTALEVLNTYLGNPNMFKVTLASAP
jgi:hypothetical protein